MRGRDLQIDNIFFQNSDYFSKQISFKNKNCFSTSIRIGEKLGEKFSIYL